MAIRTGAPTAIVATRGSRPRSRPCKRGDGPAARGGSAIGRTTEPPLPLLELNERGEEVIASEVGPQDIREVELGVRRLPEQKIRKPLLTAGPDDQVGIREIRRVQLGGERRVVNGVGRQVAVPRTGGEAAGSAAAIGTGPVLEREVQDEGLVGGGQGLHALDLAADRARENLNVAGDAETNAVAVQLLRLLDERLSQQVHQRADL